MNIKNILCAALVMSSTFTSFVVAIDNDNKELQTQVGNNNNSSEKGDSFSLTEYGLQVLLAGTLIGVGAAIGFFSGVSFGTWAGLHEGAGQTGCYGGAAGGIAGGMIYAVLNEHKLRNKYVSESEKDN